MCTLTIVPLSRERVRLAFNRDEQRNCPPSLPPSCKRFGVREAVLSIDSTSSGTWLAVNDAGLVLANLNDTSLDAKSHDSPRRSRGEIILSLLECSSPAMALETLERTIHYPEFAPFRLILVGQGIVADVRWDGCQPMVMNRLIGRRPLLFTSSGLGDLLVEDARRALFDELFAGPVEEWENIQDAFHRHHWPSREHLSVNMSPPDAQTVSYSVIDLGEKMITFLYHSDAPADASDGRLVVQEQDSLHQTPKKTVSYQLSRFRT